MQPIVLILLPYHFLSFIADQKSLFSFSTFSIGVLLPCTGCRLASGNKKENSCDHGNSNGPSQCNYFRLLSRHNKAYLEAGPNPNIISADIPFYEDEISSYSNIPSYVKTVNTLRDSCKISTLHVAAINCCDNFANIAHPGKRHC